ncbi:MAG: deoxyribodipyrimidine photo-lyase [Dehalococcoidia bacterium]|nr:deoxyribodipyrimidine photo-lyase [Dehalococcoidia bacterium]
MWLRRDLRLADNAALGEAAGGTQFAALFVFDRRLTAGRWSSPNRNWFLRESLRELRERIRERGGELFIREGSPETEVAAFAEEAGASAVYASRDYTPFATERDRRVADELRNLGVAFRLFPGTLATEPEDILSKEGRPYRSFTPFRKRWEQQAIEPPRAAPERLPPPPELAQGELPGSAAFESTATGILEAGETSAQRRLATWCETRLVHYGEGRNFLANGSTSRLSQDLRLGLLSPAQVITAARQRVPETSTYVSEIAWRDFFAHVCWHFPRVLREPFLERYRDVEWREDDESLAAWKEGRTGYPVVDAAMRELRATGYMHNRARMVTASFLAKDLLIDWREGEAHFMRHLVDGDPANNNGGWQWAASTGTDAQPFFRVFNPVLQGQKFDPDGAYVRLWSPELARVPTRHVHAPWEMSEVEQAAAGCRIGIDYPSPIVDHKEARQRAIAMYRAAAAQS